MALTQSLRDLATSLPDPTLILAAILEIERLSRDLAKAQDDLTWVRHQLQADTDDLK